MSYYNEDLYRIDQKHTHEFIGDVSIYNNHDHRVAGVSSEAIEVQGGHIHEVLTNTSFDMDHYHRASAKSSLQIPVGNNKHIHFIQGITTVDMNHSHNFEFITLI